MDEVFDPTDDQWIYVVTDIELDGPWPGANSMRSFASVAVTADGREVSVFEAVLEPLPGAAPHPDTLAWFQTQPGAWEAATGGARPIPEVMAEYVAWIKQLPAARMFAASPVAFDGTWMDYYLRRFTSHGLVQGPYEKDVLFPGGGLCVRSYAAAVTARPIADISPATLPASWFGDFEHTIEPSMTPAATPTCSGFSSASPRHERADVDANWRAVAEGLQWA